MAQHTPPRRVPRDRTHLGAGATPGGAGGGAAPGAHSHIEADITDLDKFSQAAADARFAAISHTHTESEITDLQAYLLDITGEPLGDLSNVTITAIASGELLKWNGSAFINNTLAEAGISATGHTHTESDITDLQAYLLDITNEALETLSDVTITAIASGEVLKWNGSIWINQTLAEAGISATGHTHLEADITDLQSYLVSPLTTNGDILYYNSGHQRLAKGSDTQVLTLASGVPTWAAAAGGYTDPLTTDGDILIRDTTTKRLAKGTNTQVLTLTAGLPAWEDAASGGVTDHGALTGLGDDDHTQYAKLVGDTFTGTVLAPTLILGANDPGAGILRIGVTDSGSVQLTEYETTATNTTRFQEFMDDTVGSYIYKLSWAGGSTEFFAWVANGTQKLKVSNLGIEVTGAVTIPTTSSYQFGGQAWAQLSANILRFRSVDNNVRFEIENNVTRINATTLHLRNGAGAAQYLINSTSINPAVDGVGNLGTASLQFGTGYFSSDVVVGGTSVALEKMTTNGDILYYNSGRQRLAKGTNGQVLELVAGLPAWVTTGPYVYLSGSTMTGLLVLSADPAAALGAATKQYVDNHTWVEADITDLGSYLPLAGGTLTGLVTTKSIYATDDAAEIRVGAGGDGRFYHNGTATYLYNKSGPLRIYVQNGGTDIEFYTDDTLRGTIQKDGTTDWTGVWSSTGSIKTTSAGGFYAGTGGESRFYSNTAMYLYTTLANQYQFLAHATGTWHVYTNSIQRLVVNNSGMDLVSGTIKEGGTQVSLVGHTHLEADITDLGTYLLKAGGTMTGEISWLNGSGSTALNLDSTSGNAPGLRWDNATYSVGIRMNTAGDLALGTTWFTERLTINQAGLVTAKAGLNVSAGVMQKAGVDVSLAGHTHTYLPLAGGTLTGALYLTGAAPGIRVSHTRAQMQWEQTDASTDNKGWSIRADDEQMTFKMHNDAFSNSSSWLTVDRTGFASADEVAFTTVKLSTSNNLEVANQLNVIGEVIQFNGTNVLTGSGTYTNVLDPAGANKVWISTTSIWHNADFHYIRTAGSVAIATFAATYLRPTVDGAITLGQASYRWSDIHSITTHINSKSNATTALYVGEASTLRGDAQDGAIYIYGEQTSVIAYALLKFSGSNLALSSTNASAGFQMSVNAEVLGGKWLGLRDSTQVDTFRWSHDGTNVNLVATGTSEYIMSGFTRMKIEGDIYIKSGNSLRVQDAGNTDYADFSHNGTDFLMAFTNTTVVRFTGQTSVKFGSNVKPNVDATYDLGSSGAQWRDLYLSRNMIVGGTSLLTGNVTFNGNKTQLINADPAFLWNQTGGTTDEKVWRFVARADAFTLGTLNDAEDTTYAVFTVERSGAVPTSFTFPNGYVDITNNTQGAGGLRIAGNVILSSNSYTQLYDPTGVTKCLQLNLTTSYYNNNTHYFRKSDGTHVYQMNTSAFGPQGTTSGIDLGTTTNRWEDLWISRNININDGGALIMTPNTSGGAIWTPGGANWYSSDSAKTGAITISIPNDALADMMSFEIRVFEYVTGKSFTVFVAGYAYQTGGANEWVNESAYIIQDNDSSENYTIRFGHDGTNHLIYIGELADAWSYPQVQVFNFMSGYSTTIANYQNGWDVYWEASAFENIDQTLTDVTVGAGGGGGISVTVSTSAASGGGSDGDLWCRV